MYNVIKKKKLIGGAFNIILLLVQTKYDFFLDFPFYGDLKVDCVSYFYDSLIFYLLFNTEISKYNIILINEYFNIRSFIGYLNAKYNFKKRKFIIKNFFKTKLFMKSNNVFIVFKNFNSFLLAYNNREDILKKLNVFNNFNVRFLLFTKNNIKFRKKNVKKIVFLTNLVRKANNYSYIKTVNDNIKTLNLNIYCKINIEDILKEKLFNQNKIVNYISGYLNKLKKKKKFHRKPLGSLLLCGPSGTGKTEFAKILTYSLFNSTNNLIKIDMSEYSEKNDVSKLIGSPPGYIRYGKDTILSKKFKYNSSFVVLFDEIEKAHPSINNVMLQLLDEGRITLANNVILNFNKSFVIFTSNLGCDNSYNINKNLILSEVNNFFKVEFLNRLNDIIIFNHINEYNYDNIFNKFLNDFSIKFNFNFIFSDVLKKDLIKFFYNRLYGSRPLKRFNIYLFNTVCPINKLFNFSSYCSLDYLNDFSFLKFKNVL